ncbi:hypothetical protein B5807_09029 [Epicoccum nigrum]|uniref:Uncharacterized protein n=1 Tax=Epicoccum nigrum TaxID=105696 RepID=A0A1Y2LSP3_EPING|nr:hypothetical protein B5807_09029 [Epicoccum nigrum]
MDPATFAGLWLQNAPNDGSSNVSTNAASRSSPVTRDKVANQEPSKKNFQMMVREAVGQKGCWEISGGRSMTRLQMISLQKPFLAMSKKAMRKEKGFWKMCGRESTLYAGALR